MAFIKEIEFISFDKNGAILTVVDNSNWGSPNPQVSNIRQIIDVISNISEEELLSQSTTDSGEIASIGAHEPYTISSVSLGQNVSAGFLPFEDGVLNLDHYAVMNTLVVGNAVTGDSFISLDVEADFTAYDSILIGSKLYAINKLLTTNQYVATVEDLTTDVSSFYPVYRANTKILANNVLKGRLARQAARKAICCDVECSDLEGLGVYEFSQLAFDEEDYTTANRLITQDCKCC